MQTLANACLHCYSISIKLKKLPTATFLAFSSALTLKNNFPHLRTGPIFNVGTYVELFKVGNETQRQKTGIFFHKLPDISCYSFYDSQLPIMAIPFDRFD